MTTNPLDYDDTIIISFSDDPYDKFHLELGSNTIMMMKAKFADFFGRYMDIDPENDMRRSLERSKKITIEFKDKADFRFMKSLINKDE